MDLLEIDDAPCEGDVLDLDSAAVQKAVRERNAARAFSLGCDARYHGLGLDANPFTGSRSTLHRANPEGDTLYQRWRDGWLDCNKWWAVWVFDLRRPWPVRPLPVV